jgi:hypothetical protein
MRTAPNIVVFRALIKALHSAVTRFTPRRPRKWAHHLKNPGHKISTQVLPQVLPLNTVGTLAPVCTWHSYTYELALSSLEPNVSAHRGLARAHTCCTRCRCSTHAEPLHGAHAVHRETRTLLAARPRRQIRKERKAGLSSLLLPWAIRAAWLPRRWALSRRRHHPHASHPSRARTAAQPACHQWTPTAPCLHPFGPRPTGVGG